MRSKGLISRVLVVIISIVLTLTFIPPSLITFADDNSGGGAGGGFSGGGGSVQVTDNPINDEDIGLRFSLVTKDSSGKSKVVQNIYKKYYVDVWDASYFRNNANDWYGAVNSYTRYNQPATVGNIEYFNDTDFDTTIEKLTSKSKRGSVKMNIANHLNPGGASASTFFTEGEGGLKINGDFFYNWMMEKDADNAEEKHVGTYDGETHSRYFFIINALYMNKLSGIDLSNTFLVVEPILHIANPAGDGSFQLVGTEYVASWYGYVKGNLEGRGVDPGCSFTLRDRFSNIANGFQVKETKSLKEAGMTSTMYNVLGIHIPGQYKITGGLSIAYGDGKNGTTGTRWIANGCIYNFSYEREGYAMEIFWLKGLGGLNAGDPIDTYDIINKTPNVPTNAEKPDDKNNTKGEKTVIKLYADLYEDPNTNYYTYIKDIESGNPNNKYAFVQTQTSDKVTISDEEKINGYKVSAWYTSGIEYKANDKNNDLLKASNMIAKSNVNSKRTDGQVNLESIGGNLFRIDQYQAAYSNGKGFNIKDQKYFTGLSKPHGPNGQGFAASTSKGATQYTSYKRLAVSGKSDYGTYDYKQNAKGTYVELGDANTIVILYTRKMSYISSGNYTSSTSITSTSDKRKDQSGNLTVVKMYGILDPNTYEIKDEKQVVISNATRNVNINSEGGYDLAEWIYVTGGSSKSLTASQMGNPNMPNFQCDGSADQAYRLDGFVDNFKNNQSYSQFFKFKSGNGLKMPKIYVCNASQNVNNNRIAGRYSFGSRSGIGRLIYSPTLYLGGNGVLADNEDDKNDKNDVLYILFLKTDKLSYSTDDLVIPESYLTRYDNYKHNPMTVTGSKSGTTYKELLQAHKFKYVLPVVVNRYYDDMNPLFIPHIALTSESQPGLLRNATSVHRLEIDGTSGSHNIISGYANSEQTGISDYIQLVYISKGQLITSNTGRRNIGNMLSVSALNLSYTAYRTGDQVKLANWKYSGLDNTINTYSKDALLVTDTNKVIKEIRQAAASSNLV